MLPLCHNVYHQVHSLICPFWDFMLALLCLYCILCSSLCLVSVSFLWRVSLQSSNFGSIIFLFVLFCILLNLGSCLVSIMNWFRADHPFPSRVVFYLLHFPDFFIFSLSNSNLDTASVPFTFIMSKSSVRNQIAHLKLLDDVTVGNSVWGLDINSNGIWPDFSKNFRPNKKYRGGSSWCNG